MNKDFISASIETYKCSVFDLLNIFFYVLVQPPWWDSWWKIKNLKYSFA